MSDRRVLLAVIYRLLAENAENGGSFVGAMLWSGAHNDTADQDGELLGLAKTINIQCKYDILGREVTKNMVIYGVNHMQFWPTLQVVDQGLGRLLTFPV